MKRMVIYKIAIYFTWRIHIKFFPKGTWAVADSIENCLIDMFEL